MIIKFPDTYITHKRKLPPLTYYDKHSFFGVKNIILTSSQAVDIYFAVQRCWDRQDVDSEIDLREQAKIITKERAARLRQYKNNIAETYRDILNDNEYFNNALDYAIYKYLIKLT